MLELHESWTKTQREERVSDRGIVMMVETLKEFCVCELRMLASNEEFSVNFRATSN